MTTDFYMTLPSHSDKKEFQKNAANSFKNRLPDPLILGSGWEVGLTSISVPDASVDLTFFKHETRRNEPIFHAQWRTVLASDDGKNIRSPFESQTTNVSTEFKDISTGAHNISNGVEFMKALIFNWSQKVEYYHNYYGQDKFVLVDGKRTTFEFKWEGDDLIVDNRNLLLDTPDGWDDYKLDFYTEISEKMGWIEKDPVTSSWSLGQNLKSEFIYNTEGDQKITPTHIANDKSPFLVYGKRTSLSPARNWRFTNLNKGFENVVGYTNRSLFVYSNIGGSGIVGNQRVDLLREFKYKRTGEGNYYFEPLHIHYIPIRNEVIDIIKTEVAESKGQLVDFGEGDTIVTLHFRKRG